MAHSAGLQTRRVLHYVVLVLLALWTMVPFAWSLSTALKGPQENVYSFPPRFIPEQPTLRNFVEAWTRIPHFGRYFLNSVIIAGASIALNVLFASMAGYALARLRFPGRNLAFFAVLWTLMIPFQITMIPLFIIVLRLGLLNTYAGVVLPTAISGFGIFLFRQAFLRIPDALADAARVDGCSEWTIYWRIMLPLVKPTVGTLIIFTFVASWGELLWPLIVLRDPSMYTVSVGLAYLQGQFTMNLRWIMAGSVIAIVPMILVFLVFQDFFIEGATAGALKE